MQSTYSSKTKHVLQLKTTAAVASIARAFEIARCGAVLKVEEIKTQLAEEGFDPGRVVGSQLYRQLDALMMAYQSKAKKMKESH